MLLPEHLFLGAFQPALSLNFSQIRVDRSCMSFTWCSTCGSDVVDVEGYCMLGHRLGVKEFAHFRAEEPAPAPARVSAPASVAPSAARSITPVRTTAPPVRAAAPAAPVPVRAATPRPSAVSIPATVPLYVPPPPPPPPVGEPATVPARVRDLWRQLEDLDTEVRDDPIEAFAPAPRMDWGPDEALPMPRGLRSLLRKSGRLESLAG
ncbi:MAG: hypothetical protein ACRDI1_00990 [Actinomycetota bacterium]